VAKKDTRHTMSHVLQKKIVLTGINILKNSLYNYDTFKLDENSNAPAKYYFSPGPQHYVLHF
jgi:hypothetical protein